jgi:hypothetical protein
LLAFAATFAFNLAVAAAEERSVEDKAETEFSDLRWLPHTWLEGGSSPFAI